jgi:hypothetical protein
MTEPWMKTAARGYGAVHQKLRAQAKALVDSGGAVCWRCGIAINPGEPFDLGHDDHDRGTYRGPEHRRCNRATNGRGKKSGGKSLTGPRQGRARNCEICGGGYTASSREQRTCSRACGWELRRRNAPHPVAPPPLRSRPMQTRQCSECERTYETSDWRRVTCGDECSKARQGRMMREHYHTNPEYRAATIERAKQRYQAKRWAL